MLGVAWQPSPCRKECVSPLSPPGSAAHSMGTGRSPGLGPRVHEVAMAHLHTDGGKGEG